MRLLLAGNEDRRIADTVLVPGHNPASYDSSLPHLFEMWAPAGGACLMPGVDNVKTGLSGREVLNGVAEPGPDLLEIDVLDFTKSMRAKNHCHAGRLETADRMFTHSLELFVPRLF